MGDERRFDRFADFISSRFPKDYKIGDIAGGKGYLQLALRERGFNSVITYDKRFDNHRLYKVKVRGKSYKIDYRYKHFNQSVKEEFDILVGMHCDEATDHIIVEASKRNIPWIIVPCCVKPSAVRYLGSNNFNDWVSHLVALAEENDYRVDNYLIQKVDIKVNCCKCNILIPSFNAEVWKKCPKCKEYLD